MYVEDKIVKSFIYVCHAQWGEHSYILGGSSWRKFAACMSVIGDADQPALHIGTYWEAAHEECLQHESDGDAEHSRDNENLVNFKSCTF